MGNQLRNSLCQNLSQDSPSDLTSMLVQNIAKSSLSFGAILLVPLLWWQSSSGTAALDGEWTVSMFSKLFLWGVIVLLGYVIGDRISTATLLRSFAAKQDESRSAEYRVAVRRVTSSWYFLSVAMLLLVLAIRQRTFLNSTAYWAGTVLLVVFFLVVLYLLTDTHPVGIIRVWRVMLAITAVAGLMCGIWGLRRWGLTVFGSPAELLIFQLIGITAALLSTIVVATAIITHATDRSCRIWREVILLFMAILGFALSVLLHVRVTAWSIVVLSVWILVLSTSFALSMRTDRAINPPVLSYSAFLPAIPVLVAFFFVLVPPSFWSVHFGVKKDRKFHVGVARFRDVVKKGLQLVEPRRSYQEEFCSIFESLLARGSGAGCTLPFPYAAGEVAMERLPFSVANAAQAAKLANYYDVLVWGYGNMLEVHTPQSNASNSLGNIFIIMGRKARKAAELLEHIAVRRLPGFFIPWAAPSPSSFVSSLGSPYSYSNVKDVVPVLYQAAILSRWLFTRTPENEMGDLGTALFSQTELLRESPSMSMFGDQVLSQLILASASQEPSKVSQWIVQTEELDKEVKMDSVVFLMTLGKLHYARLEYNEAIRFFSKAKDQALRRPGGPKNALVEINLWLAHLRLIKWLKSLFTEPGVNIQKVQQLCRQSINDVRSARALMPLTRQGDPERSRQIGRIAEVLDRTAGTLTEVFRLIEDSRNDSAKSAQAADSLAYLWNWTERTGHDMEQCRSVPAVCIAATYEFGLGDYVGAADSVRKYAEKAFALQNKRAIVSALLLASAYKAKGDTTKLKEYRQVVFGAGLKATGSDSWVYKWYKSIFE